MRLWGAACPSAAMAAPNALVATAAPSKPDTPPSDERPGQACLVQFLVGEARRIQAVTTTSKENVILLCVLSADFAGQRAAAASIARTVCGNGSGIWSGM